MITFGITSYKEPKTIGRAIESIVSQANGEYEIIVCAPDEETLSVAREKAKRNKKIKVIKDSGNGKPSAMNLLVSKARGDIILFTDGDVLIDRNAVSQIIEIMKDKKVGAVSGRPVSINNRENKMGFWAFMLTEIAHERRIIAQQLNRRFFVSGYLFAIRKNLFPKLPEELLSEDGYISHKVYEAGYSIRYSPSSKVLVKYPENFSDWIKQKKRSAGGYNQIKKMLGVEIRSFKSESLGGMSFFKFATSLKHIWWIIDLFISRIYLWFLIYVDINLRQKSQKEIWQRVDSTK